MDDVGGEATDIAGSFRSFEIIWDDGRAGAGSGQSEKPVDFGG
jgi:hypothetical protein